jgi:hypothetical protein
MPRASARSASRGRKADASPAAKSRSSSSSKSPRKAAAKKEETAVPAKAKSPARKSTPKKALQAAVEKESVSSISPALIKNPPKISKEDNVAFTHDAWADSMIDTVGVVAIISTLLLAILTTFRPDVIAALQGTIQGLINK